jgi:hypothetical protein
VDLQTIKHAVARLGGLRKSARPELEALARGDGAPAAVAIAILNDAANAKRLLEGNDRATQALLLAMARLCRADLPLDRVDQLMDVAELRQPAELYLQANDSIEARKLLLARSPNQARILGFRHPEDYGTLSATDPREEALRTEILGENAPDEIFALFSTDAHAGDIIIRIRGGVAELAVENRTQPIAPRKLTAAELAGLRKLLTDLKFDDLPFCETRVIDGTQQGYVHLTRTGGRRVFMNNAWYAAGSAYDRVCRHFARLASAK